MENEDLRIRHLLSIMIDMKKLLDKITLKPRSKQLNPEKPQERKMIVQEAVRRTINEYGEALKRLGAE